MMCNPRGVEVPDVNGAVRDFILWGALDMEGTPLAPARVFLGHQNRVSLPPGTEEYAVAVNLSTRRGGTNAERYDGASGTLATGARWLADFQVYVCSQEIATAHARAVALATVGGSALGVRFMRARGLDLLEVSELRQSTVQVDSGQFVQRYGLTLSVGFLASVPAGQEGAERLEVGARPAEGRYFENVDAHHPPKES